MTRFSPSILAISIAAAIGLGIFSPLARAAKTPPKSPEEETLEISKLLKPIPDKQWEQIAGDRINEKYTIVQGDTLYDVSKRLFGDARYWPKLWALNNGTITNPHLIRPGNTIAFLPGTGTALPAVAIQPQSLPPATPTSPDAIADAASSAATTPGAAPAAGAAAPATSNMTPADQAAAAKLSALDEPPRSQEWKKLPPQDWEEVNIQLPSDVDAQGFDRDVARVTFGKNQGVDLPAFCTSEKLPTLGEITGSRVAANYLSIGDLVYISSDDGLQVGETYAITRDPQKLRNPRSDRLGYSYLVLGKVKVIGVKDKLFVGTILDATDFIERGDAIIKTLPRVPPMKPIPGPNPIAGTLMIDKTYSTGTTAQHKLVYVDRGAEDGISVGMVFRAYQHSDPGDDRKITDSDFIILADMQVYQVSERFSAALIINSLEPIHEGQSVVLLTDVSDVSRFHAPPGRTLGNPKTDSELDQLDQLDTGGGLGKQEQKDLEQLEQYQPPAPTDQATPEPDATAAPADQAPPPPADQGTPPPPDDGSAAAAPSPAPAPNEPSTDTLPPPPADSNAVPSGDLSAPPPPADSGDPNAAPEGEIPPPPAPSPQPT